MVSLRYDAGKVRDEKIHEIGVLALGSHLENHGPALPIDTDAKIASYIAFNASLLSGAKYLGVVYPSYELDEIDHGEHNSIEEVVEEIITLIKSAKKYLHIKKVIIVNGHGGNIPVFEYLYTIEDNTGVDILLNNRVVESEGPHGGSGEISMGKVLGIVDENEIQNQDNLDKYGEIGLYAFTKARENDPGIEKGAKDVEINGIYLDEVYGEQLLSLAINSVLLDMEKLLDY